MKRVIFFFMAMTFLAIGNTVCAQVNNSDHKDSGANIICSAADCLTDPFFYEPKDSYGRQMPKAWLTGEFIVSRLRAQNVLPKAHIDAIERNLKAGFVCDGNYCYQAPPFSISEMGNTGLVIFEPQPGVKVSNSNMAWTAIDYSFTPKKSEGDFPHNKL